MQPLRPPAVAGSFYPSEPEPLRALVRALLDAAHPAGAPPKAVIAPHAGYAYSGPVAASAHARLALGRDRIRRVVLAGPSHRYPFRGLAVPDVEAFATPLGAVPVDLAAVAALLALPQVRRLDAAHVLEHSLEVHLPFLQACLGGFRLVPLVVGEAGPEAVAGALERVWGGPETVVVISSDLSHYFDQATARQLDRATSEAILSLREDAVEPEGACGCLPVRGLLQAARAHGLRAELLDLRTSGDLTGDLDRVVGYGAYAFV